MKNQKGSSKSTNITFNNYIFFGGFFKLSSISQTKIVAICNELRHFVIAHCNVFLACFTQIW